MKNKVIVMGVSGCGKSTLASAIASDNGWHFIEGDDLHPPENVNKMRQGIALSDADRIPFLQNVATAVAQSTDGVVASCSALKRCYRDSIRLVCPEVVFLLPNVPASSLERRMRRRKGHFMPVSLLYDQLNTLEPLSPDEHGLIIEGNALSEENRLRINQFLQRN